MPSDLTVWQYLRRMSRWMYGSLFALGMYGFFMAHQITRLLDASERDEQLLAGFMIAFILYAMDAAVRVFRRGHKLLTIIYAKEKRCDSQGQTTI